MIDMEKLGRSFFRARFALDVAHEGIVTDERIPDEEIDEYMAVLVGAVAQFKEISDTIAMSSAAFCRGYLAANREAVEAGRSWSEQRAEKIALLRLSGDDTPEDQIPI